MPNLGLTLDFGHSLAALEQPAEAVVLAMTDGWLKQVHLNDNRRDWDLDLIPGATTVWEHVEFYYWLMKLNYNGWFSADVFNYRQDGTESLQRVVHVHRTCCRVAEKLMTMDIEQILRDGDPLHMHRILWELID